MKRNNLRLLEYSTLDEFLTYILGFMGAKAIKEFNRQLNPGAVRSVNEKCKTQCSHRTQTQPKVMGKEFSVLAELFPEK